MYKVTLTEEEKRVIKKISRVQIESLKSIVNRDTIEDLTLFSLFEEIEENELINAAQSALVKFERIRKRPIKLFELDKDNLSMAKHVLTNFTNHKKYEEGKRAIWRKFIIMERPLNLN